MQVLVRDNNVDQALRALKKKMQREGVFREMKIRRHYEKPSERRAREKAEAIRRARKLARKRLQREGLLPMILLPNLPKWLAIFWHKTESQCLLLGVKRTSGGRASMSAYDPKRTWGGLMPGPCSGVLG